MSKRAAEQSPSEVSCESSDVSELRSRADALRRDVGWFTSHARDLRQSACAVLASRDAKLRDDALSGLSSRIDDASSVLASSDGRVDDDGPRQSLAGAIDEAGRMRGNEKSGVKDFNDSSQVLTDAISAVNGAIQTRDDRETREAAQAWQPTATTKPPTGGHQNAQPRPGASTPAPPSNGGGEQHHIIGGNDVSKQNGPSHGEPHF